MGTGSEQGAAGRVARLGAMLLAIGLLTSLVTLLPDANSAAQESNPDVNEDTEGFVTLALSVFPDLSEEQALCIAGRALPSMSIETIRTMFTDRDAPVKATPDEQQALSGAIDGCVDRSTAVAAISTWTRSLLTGPQVGLGPAGGLPYDTLLCIDSEVGELRVSEAFYSMYRRPTSFLTQVGATMRDCLNGETAAELLQSWVGRYGAASSNRASTEELFVPSADPVGTQCLSSALVSDEEFASLLEQVIVAASPDPASHTLTDLHEAAAACGMPLSRNYGR